MTSLNPNRVFLGKDIYSELLQVLLRLICIEISIGKGRGNLEINNDELIINIEINENPQFINIGTSDFTFMQSGGEDGKNE